MTSYCTLDEAKNELKAEDTVGDDLLRTAIRQISRRIDSLMDPLNHRPYFAPYDEQRAFQVTTRKVDSWQNTFRFDENLLAFTAVLLATTDITAVVEKFPELTRVIKALRFTTTGRSWYERISNTRIPVYTKITGAWGFHRDFDNAWVGYDTLQANINASVTTAAVGDADGIDPFGFTPRFSPGTLCRIGTEYLEVTSISTNDLTVRRGVNGSTAAAHSSGDSVEVWQVEHPIRRVVCRQAGLFYARRGVYQAEILDGVGVISYPQDLLPELMATLSEYSYA